MYKQIQRDKSSYSPAPLKIKEKILMLKEFEHNDTYEDEEERNKMSNWHKQFKIKQMLSEIKYEVGRFNKHCVSHPEI